MFTNGYTRVALIVLAVILVLRMAQAYYKKKEPLDAGPTGNVSSDTRPNVVAQPGMTFGLQSNVDAAPQLNAVATNVANASKGIDSVPIQGLAQTVTSQTQLGNSILSGTAAERLNLKPAGFDINPADLLPIPDPALIPNVVPDPGFSRNFLLNSLQSGVPTGSKRNFNYDMRKVYAPPITVVPLFDQPTFIPDMNRKSFDSL